MDGDHVAFETRRAGRLDVQVAQSLHPEPERPFRNREADSRHLATAGAPLWPGGPAEEGHRGPRRAEVVAEVDVVRVRHVLVDALLHEAQTEHADVEVDVPLNIACDAGHVVNARDGGRQRADPHNGWLRPKPMLSPSPPRGGVQRFCAQKRVMRAAKPDFVHKSGLIRWGAPTPLPRPGPRSQQPWVRAPLPAGARPARSRAP